MTVIVSTNRTTPSKIITVSNFTFCLSFFPSYLIWHISIYGTLLLIANAHFPPKEMLSISGLCHTLHSYSITQWACSGFKTRCYLSCEHTSLLAIKAIARSFSRVTPCTFCDHFPHQQQETSCHLPTSCKFIFLYHFVHYKCICNSGLMLTILQNGFNWILFSTLGVRIWWHFK